MYLFIYLDWGRKGEREGEKHWCGRETVHGCLLYMPWLGSEPATQDVAWRGIELLTFALWNDAQPTKPHQSGQG